MYIDAAKKAEIDLHWIWLVAGDSELQRPKKTEKLKL
jgi:hypothetical protein